MLINAESELVVSAREKSRRNLQSRLAVSQAEMAELLGISTATAARMIRKRVVGSVKVGNRRLIPMIEIERLLAAA